MIFDDHNIRDDWNTSWSWRQEMASTTWWHDRVVGGLGSYWVYQHLGNLGPDDRSEDVLWQRIASYDGPEELDVGTSLPFLLAPGLHHIESFSEAIAEGSWGRFGKWVGERARVVADLEHWAAFQKGFRDVAEMVLEVAPGRRGRATGRSRAASSRRSARQSETRCRGVMKGFTAVAAKRATGLAGRLLSLSGRVPLEPIRWASPRARGTTTTSRCSSSDPPVG